MSKLPYVILIGPAVPASYLTLEPEESDGEVSPGPARTTDSALAITFSEFTDARAALRQAVERFAAHEFRIDVLKPAA